MGSTHQEDTGGSSHKAAEEPKGTILDLLRQEFEELGVLEATDQQPSSKRRMPHISLVADEGDSNKLKKKADKCRRKRRSSSSRSSKSAPPTTAPSSRSKPVCAERIDEEKNDLRLLQQQERKEKSSTSSSSSQLKTKSVHNYSR